MKKRDDINKKIATSIAIGVLFLAIVGSLPYGFFNLLRLVLFGTTVYLSWLAYKINKQGWIWSFGFVALIFNPLVPIHLGRDLWVVVDLLVGVFLFVSLFTFKLEKRDKLD
jgi:Family of unknown function (DUF6804)